MSAGPGWARIVAMSCLIAACDGGGDTDAGASPDGAVMDAGGGDDAGSDAGPIDGGPMIGRTAEMSFQFVDVELGGTPDGLEVCVPQFPSIPCGTVAGDGRAIVRVPVGQQYVAATAPGHRRLLFPVDVPVGGGEVGGIPIFSDALVATAATAAMVAVDDALAMVLVAVADADSGDPETLVGATMAGVDGTITYIVDNPDGTSVPDPSLSATSGAGAAWAFNVSPGTHSVTWTQPGASCANDIAGWTPGEMASLEMPAEAGAITLSWLNVTGLHGRDARECDVVTQDCAAGQKCRGVFFVDRDRNDSAGTACVTDGSVAEGGSCARVDDVPGDDDCTAGTFCAYWGLPRSDPQARRCLAFCAADSQCDAGEVCLGLGTMDLSGSCAATCDPFGADCVAGTHCAPRASIRDGMTGAAIICNFDGAGGEGATCGSPDDCGAGMACVDATGALECRTLCDATHACPGGSACTDLTDVPGLGFCPVET